MLIAIADAAFTQCWPWQSLSNGGHAASTEYHPTVCHETHTWALHWYKELASRLASRHQGLPASGLRIWPSGMYGLAGIQYYDHCDGHMHLAQVMVLCLQHDQVRAAYAVVTLSMVSSVSRMSCWVQLSSRSAHDGLRGKCELSAMDKVHSLRESRKVHARAEALLHH